MNITTIPRVLNEIAQDFSSPATHTPSIDRLIAQTDGADKIRKGIAGALVNLIQEQNPKSRAQPELKLALELLED